MRQLFSISRSKDNSHLVWEHLMKSALAFAGTFTATFFGPMMLGARRYSPNRGSEDSFTGKIVLFILENPLMNFAICGVILVIYNIVVFRKNSRVEHISSVSMNEIEIEITNVNLRFSKQKTIRIKKTDCTIEFNMKEDEFGEKFKKIKFFENEKLIGFINPKNHFWNEKLPEIQRMINELKQENIEFRKVEIKNKSKGFFN